MTIDDKLEPDFLDHVEDMLSEAAKHETCMSLFVSEDGKSVELILDTAVSTYSEWIPGEGADIGLIRCQETHKVMGVHLPLYRNNLMVSHQGPIRINCGFRKVDAP